MRAIGALVVGIGRYRLDPARLPPLRYATADADQIVEYLTACWPSADQATIVHISEENATTAGLEEAFRELAAHGPFDLQFVFMSGHGLAEAGITGFVVQPSDGSSALAILSPATLDQYFECVSCRRTLFILDCCHAEAITRRMQFFTALGDSEARLFVASSRENQFTWEDERIGHSIFTAHLLDLLRTGSSVALKAVRDRLDVDSELFRVLCDQVPLYVLEHQHQRQEPVKGGVSVRPISLPVARSTRRIKERTALATAVRRIRQIAVALGLIAVVFLMSAYLFLYYAQADQNGNIQLHHGARWMGSVFRFLPTLRADSAMSWTELSDSPSSRYAVQAGDAWGFWTQVSRHGYRSWYDAVRPSLDPLAATRYDILLGIAAARPVLSLTDNARPSEVAFAAWALLDNSDAGQMETLFKHILGADRIDPLLVPFSASQMDFGVIDRPQSQLASFADALRSAATVDPNRTFRPFLGFLKATQMWLTHSSAERHGVEAQRRAAEDVADVLAAIAKARVDRGATPLDPAQLALLYQLGRLGYEELIRLAVSRVVVDPVDRQREMTSALAAFHGSRFELSEANAIRRLKDLLDASPASQAVVDKVYRLFVSVGGAEQSDLTAFLIAAADKKALPKNLLSTLLKAADEALARKERAFMDTEYARILAHAMSQIPEASRSAAYRLIEAVTAVVTPRASSTAEMYAALGRQKLETPAMLARVVEQSASAPAYQTDTPDVVSEPLPGFSIVVGYGPWLEALAIFAMNRDIPPEALETLKRHVVNPALREIILPALARRAGTHEPACWTRVCGQLLNAFPKDGRKRHTATEILAYRLAGLPRGEFIEAIDSLRRERSSEIEPEIRIALGLATVNAQLARVRTVPIGAQLFEPRP